MTSPEGIVSILIRSIPTRIGRIAVRHPGLREAAGLTAIELKSVGHFLPESITKALSDLQRGEGVDITDREGKSHRLQCGTETLSILIEGDGSRTKAVDEFGLFHPNAESRCHFLDLILERRGVWALPFAGYRQRLATSVPSMVEFLDVLQGLQHTLPLYGRRLEAKWTMGGLTVEDLIPTSLSYYESLLGPSPKVSESALKYIDSTLPAAIANRWEARPEESMALVAAMAGMFDLRLLPAVKDDVLAGALFNLGESPNPYVALGAIRECLRRGGDDLLKVADKQLERLAYEPFGEGPLAHGYKLFPSLAHLAMAVLGTEEEFSTVPLYWRRLAAFAHATVLLERLVALGVEQDKFIEWCSARHNGMMTLRALLDVRIDPFWFAGNISPDSTHALILGRTYDACVEAETRSTVSKGAAGFAGVVQRVVQSRGGLMALGPGPLSHVGSPVPFQPPLTGDEGAIKAMADHVQLLGGPAADIQAWHRAATLSVLVGPTEDLRKTLLSAVEKLDSAAIFFWEALSIAALVAAQDRNGPIAVAVAKRAVECEGTVEDAEAAFKTLVLASAALTEGVEAKLEDWLLVLAHQLKKGPPCERLLDLILLLERVTPIESWRFSKAKAACRAALLV